MDHHFYVFYYLHWGWHPLEAVAADAPSIGMLLAQITPAPAADLAAS
jgi:hypothetical protein